MGVPKTIDNDLMVTDHTPGYGSAAKYIGVVMKELIRDATVYGTNYVTIVEIMGRNVRLADRGRRLGPCRGLRGRGHDLPARDPVQRGPLCGKGRPHAGEKAQRRHRRVRGRQARGRPLCLRTVRRRPFGRRLSGHRSLTGTARFLANTVGRRLNTKTRCIELATLQRCAGHVTSRPPTSPRRNQVGGAAVKAAFEGHTGEMVAIKRVSNAPYQSTTELHPISEVANLEKKVPLEWINADHTDMLPEFIAYAMPLIQAELTPIYVEGLPHHIYLPE